MFCVPFLWVLIPGARSAPPAEDAAAMLAKASAAFESNRLQEIHWNWVSVEQRVIVDQTGKLLQPLPDVAIEAVIRSDGKRCTAVNAWGDGVPAYLANADPDARCKATDANSAMEISALLKSRRVKFAPQSAAGIKLSILPDKGGLRSKELEDRCAASIRATVLLDTVTYFPRIVEGEVVDTGCDQARATKIYYDGPVNEESVRSSIHKGTSFRVEYELQQDKFGSPERNFWIAARRHDRILRWIRGGNFIFWGRRFAIISQGSAQYIVKDTTSSAHEFGAQSTIR